MGLDGDDGFRRAGAGAGEGIKCISCRLKEMCSLWLCRSLLAACLECWACSLEAMQEAVQKDPRNVEPLLVLSPFSIIFGSYLEKT